MKRTPAILSFEEKGRNNEGFISIADFSRDIPFEVKRAFWTYGTPGNFIRGNHAHFETEQVIIAVSGEINVTLRSAKGDSQGFLLDSPDTGLYVPPGYWRSMKYSADAVQLVLASTNFHEKDYIRSLKEFTQYWNNKDL